MRERVLVIRPGALGDTILTLPLLESVRRRHPNATIVFLGTGMFRDLIPQGTEFHGIDESKWLWLFGRDCLNVSASFSGLPTHAYVVLNRPWDVISNLRRAGVENIICASSTPPPGKHVVEHVHDELGLPIPERIPSLVHLRPASAPDLLWIHPGSGGRRKCVPPEFLANYAEGVNRRRKLPIAITMGEADGFLKAEPGWKRLVGMPNTTVFEHRPLLEICRELGGASLFIGNDSGIAHLASGLGIRCRLFFVSTDPAQWAPWGPAEQIKTIALRGETAG